MPTPDQTSPRRRDADGEYYYRRKLGLRDLLPAIGIAVGAGLFAFYVTRLLMQRTPLRIDQAADRLRRRAKSLERSARP